MTPGAAGGSHAVRFRSTSPAAILLGMLVAATAAVLGIEVLSAMGAVRQWPLRTLMALCAAAFVLTVRHCHTPLLASQEAETPQLPLATLLAIGAVTLLIAVLAAPNTWDSMTYHMARVAEWFDHGHVRHYYTHIDRQLWQPPFAEYLVLLGYGALGGRDYIANIPQWLGGVGAVLVTMEIARTLGAGRRERYLVGLLTATAPIVILQATSTHTDLLGGFWVAVAAWLALSEMAAPTSTTSRALFFGAALGLALGTKGTSLLVGLPWLLVFGFAAARIGTRFLLTRLVLVTMMVVALNGAHAVRNAEVFGHPLGPASAQLMLRPASMTPPALASNALAHASLHFGTPWPEANQALARSILAVHTAVGLDPSRLYPYFGGFNVVPWTTREDIAGNPVHVILALLAAVLILRHWRRLTRLEWIAVGAVVVGVLAFVAGVRWGPFIARLHTPLIILLGPCLLLVLVRRWPRMASMSSAVALLFALPALLFNQSRPLVSGGLPQHLSIGARSILTAPRAIQYLVNRPELFEPYQAAIGVAHAVGCRRVAVVAGYDSFEYPLWAYGRPYDIRFQHEDQRTINASRGAGPCLLLALDQPNGWRPAFASDASRPILVRERLTAWRRAELSASPDTR